MGDMADYYLDQIERQHLNFELFGYWDDDDILEDDEWQTKDGKVYKIKDMSESHIINTYNYLKRKGRDIPKMIKERYAEIAFRKQKVALIRKEYDLPDEISDEEIIKAYKGSSLEARVELHLAIEKVKKDIMNVFNISKFLKA